ncbi:hypothetical protein GCM10012288_05290 [Malaciobacter pacificus]|uniref:Uncharacterized protein n=1 Tax=Malaciobacter pacificus TaxID=1080223 RepID=A0A5C2H6N0_9BACT|nr:hypothetical protein [Malaciobacter pacificus]QEP34473.1 hypothetical protein APAC_1359 [Malaciobacter pacificus]GGD34253.1 hypothetical protein GCM10012288_05290 [Malaciobacter pacificus]
MENLKTFDIQNFTSSYSEHIRFKKDGIEISCVDFNNTNFSLDAHFINQCRKAVNQERQNFSLLELSSHNETYEKIEIVFKNCKFANITVNEQIIRDDIFIEFDINDEKVKNLQMNFIRISTSKFHGKFYINKQYDGYKEEFSIFKLLIENSIFYDNFKLHKCKIEEIHIKDCDFERNADFFKSKFLSGEKQDKQQIEIYFHALNFRGLVLFGDVYFYKKFHLQYVTIEGYSHFRNAIFEEGLDLDYANIQHEMNFFGCKGLEKLNSRKNTSQETYRIIKHNFKKLNNTIEANQYHSLELSTHRKNIKILDAFLDCRIPLQNILDWLVSFFHLITSNYSKNWFLTLIWIVIVSIGTNLCLEHELYLNKQINWECIFKYLNILTSKDDFDNSYIAMTFNKVLLGYLYYQFLTAIRRNTKE